MGLEVQILSGKSSNVNPYAKESTGSPTVRGKAGRGVVSAIEQDATGL